MTQQNAFKKLHKIKNQVHKKLQIKDMKN